MEGTPAIIVTAETRDICEKCRYRALRETRFKTHYLKKALTRYSEQKINKVNRVSSFFKKQCENTSTN